MGITLFLLLVLLFYFIIFQLLRNVDHGEKPILLTFLATVTIVFTHALVDNPFNVPAIALVLIFSLGMISLREKEHSILSPSGINWRIPKLSISFGHSHLLRLIGLVLFMYSVFSAVSKAEGYMHWQNGLFLAARGNWHAGINEYELARRALPSNGELAANLGSAYAYTRQPYRTIDLLGASQQRFNDRNIYIAQGYALMQLNRLDEAEESFKTALRMYPKLLLPRLWLAEMYRSTDRKQEAMEKLREILSIQPKVITDDILNIKRDAGKLLEILDSVSLESVNPRKRTTP